MKEQTPIFTPGELRLVKGPGDYSKAEACVMSAARAIYRIENGLPLGDAGDHLNCACPVIRRLCIARNDGPWESDEERTSWGVRLIPAIIGSLDCRLVGDRLRRCMDLAHDVAGYVLTLREAGRVLNWDANIIMQTFEEVMDRARLVFAYPGTPVLLHDAARASVQLMCFVTMVATSAGITPARDAWGWVEDLIEELLGLGAGEDPTGEDAARLALIGMGDGA